MFFRREKIRPVTFDARLDQLRQAGFRVDAAGSGRVKVSKVGCAALLEDSGGEPPSVGKGGILVHGEVAHLEHGGYQMFFRTPDGRKVPALAEHLRALHDFEEDLKEVLGLTSLYNMSLGTRSDQHMYDRVKGRDRRP